MSLMKAIVREIKHIMLTEKASFYNILNINAILELQQKCASVMVWSNFHRKKFFVLLFLILIYTLYIYIIENLSSQLSLIYYSAVATRKLVLLCYLSKLWAKSYTKNSILCQKVNYRLELNYKQIHEIGLNKCTIYFPLTIYFQSQANCD